MAEFIGPGMNFDDPGLQAAIAAHLLTAPAAIINGASATATAAINTKLTEKKAAHNKSKNSY